MSTYRSKNKTGGGAGTNQYAVRGTSKAANGGGCPAPKADLMAMVRGSGPQCSEMSVAAVTDENIQKLAQETVVLHFDPTPENISYLRELLVPTALVTEDGHTVETCAENGWGFDLSEAERDLRERQRRYQEVWDDPDVWSGPVNNSPINLTALMALGEYLGETGDELWGPMVEDTAAALRRLRDQTKLTVKAVHAQFYQRDPDTWWKGPRSVVFLGGESDALNEEARSLEERRAEAEQGLQDLS